MGGVFSEWSAWGSCSATCGGGSQTRTRFCTPPQNGGQDCQGDSTEQQPCNSQPCPVDGVWSSWSAWSDCSAPCGGGIQTATRTCTPPQHGGQDCQGSSSEEQTCNVQACPVDGVWSSWSAWSTCTASCGGGVEARTRSYTPPKHGGQDCQDPAVRSRHVMFKLVQLMEC